MTEAADPLDFKCTYEYDWLGRKTAETRQLGDRHTVEYYDTGKVKTETSPIMDILRYRGD